MREILESIAEHPWAFIGLAIGSCMVAGEIGKAIGGKEQ